MIFLLAGVYNLGFAIWLLGWPHAVFDLFEIPQQWPTLLTQGVGIVIALFGAGYLYAAWRMKHAWPIILLGLGSKVVPPLAWIVLVSFGNWPVHTFFLILFDDLIWWVPFTRFLLSNSKLHGKE